MEWPARACATAADEGETVDCPTRARLEAEHKRATQDATRDAGHRCRVCGKAADAT